MCSRVRSSLAQSMIRELDKKLRLSSQQVCDMAAVEAEQRKHCDDLMDRIGLEQRMTRALEVMFRVCTP